MALDLDSRLRGNDGIVKLLRWCHPHENGDPDAQPRIWISTFTGMTGLRSHPRENLDPVPSPSPCYG